jgi:hypothetical protein
MSNRTVDSQRWLGLKAKTCRSGKTKKKVSCSKLVLKICLYNITAQKMHNVKSMQVYLNHNFVEWNFVYKLYLKMRVTMVERQILN